MHQRISVMRKQFFLALPNLKKGLADKFQKICIKCNFLRIIQGKNIKSHKILDQMDYQIYIYIYI